MAISDEDRKYAHITLDRTRPDDVGEVHGEETRGAYWYQDGLPFDFQGRLCEDILTADELVIVRRRDARMKAEAAAKAARDNAMRAAGFEAEDETKAKGEEGAADKIPLKHESLTAETDEDVDLRAWFDGRKQYIFSKVAKKMASQFGVRPTDGAKAREMLATEFGVSYTPPPAGPAPRAVD